MAEPTPAADHKFYPAMATLIAVVVFAGFTPSFYARPSDVGPLALPALLHGVAGTLFVLTFAVQSWLVAVGRTRWHRQLGVAGGVLAAVFLTSGIGVTLYLEVEHIIEPRRMLIAHLWTNAAPLAAFAVLVGVGLAQRRVPARHKRLMLLAAVVLLPPATGRLFAPHDLAWLNLPVYACAAGANAVYDVIVRGKPHVLSSVPAVALIAIDITTTVWLAAVGS